MACPTCDHAMHVLQSNSLGAKNLFRRHWCPECGTLRNVVHGRCDEETISDDVPRIVDPYRDLLVVAEKLLWWFPDLPEILGGQSTREANQLIMMARVAILKAKS